MTALRRVRRFGDGALVADVDAVGDAHGLADVVRDAAGWHGVEDVVVGYRTVTVVVDPSVTDTETMAGELARLPAAAPHRGPKRRVEIPVAFDGPDLDVVAGLAAMSPGAVVDALVDAELSVAFLGFLPGFAYIDGLPDALAGLPRRSSPRTAVAAGSVALGGGFAGVYPQASPGGWHIVGRTGFGLFDPDTAPFATLRPGDAIRLRAVTDPGVPATPVRPPLRSSTARTVVVEAPGLLSMVQDLGRRGVARLGVPRAGAADPYALRGANRLVGNGDGAAALEITALGPRLRFGRDADVAVVGGAEVTVDGRPVEVDTVVPVAAGQTLAVTRTIGALRCYLAVSGGFEVTPVLGSRSSDVLTGLGPGALAAGDVLGMGPAGRPRGALACDDTRDSLGGGASVVRVMAGPDEPDTDVVARLCAETWEVGSASDRVGVRLHGDRPLPVRTPGIASLGTVTGAIQVPPGGVPVALLCDHATVGGYPVVATVVRADVGVLGRLRPGDPVRFEPVDHAQAHEARVRAERALETAASGWYPVRTD